MIDAFEIAGATAGGFFRPYGTRFPLPSIPTVETGGLLSGVPPGLGRRERRAPITQGGTAMIKQWPTVRLGDELRRSEEVKPSCAEGPNPLNLPA
jgi:hypothetical protein